MMMDQVDWDILSDLGFVRNMSQNTGKMPGKIFINCHLSRLLTDCND
jgi:hypothetical protein